MCQSVPHEAHISVGIALIVHVQCNVVQRTLVGAGAWEHVCEPLLRTSIHLFLLTSVTQPSGKCISTKWSHLQVRVKVNISTKCYFLQVDTHAHAGSFTRSSPRVSIAGEVAGRACTTQVLSLPVERSLALADLGLLRTRQGSGENEARKWRG